MIKVAFDRNKEENRNELQMEIHTGDGDAGMLAEATIMMGAIVNALANKVGMKPEEIAFHIALLLPSCVKMTNGETTVVEAENNAGGVASMIKAAFDTNREDHSTLKLQIHVDDGLTGALAEIVMMFGAIINSVAKSEDIPAMEICAHIMPLMMEAVNHTADNATVVAVRNNGEAGDDD